MKRKARRSICIKALIVAFIFPFIQSCTADNNEMTNESVSLAAISGVENAFPLPKLSEDRVALIDSIMETHTIQEYIGTLKRFKKKVEPYTVSLGEEKTKEFRENMRDASYTKGYLKEMCAEIDIENELQELKKSWGKIMVITKNLDLSVDEQVALFAKTLREIR